MQLPYKLNHQLPTMTAIAQLYEKRPRQLDLSRTGFIRPTVLAPLALYLQEQSEAFLVNASPRLQEAFKEFGSSSDHMFGLHYFSSSKDVGNGLERFFPKGFLLGYLYPFLDLLGPGICCGHSNIAGDWAFFSVCSKALPALDDFRWHQLLDEFYFTGSRVWIMQGNRFHNGRKVVEIPHYFPKTWVIFGILRTNLGF